MKTGTDVLRRSGFQHGAFFTRSAGRVKAQRGDLDRARLPSVELWAILMHQAWRRRWRTTVVDGWAM